MKRSCALLFFLLFFLYNGGAGAEPLSAAVIDAETGRVLYAKNAEQELPMASTTKIMTALVAIERGGLSDLVTAGENAYGVPGTSIYLDRGEKLTLEQMLYGLMLASGNDAAVAIAEHVGGSVAGFCELMNARAAALGCAHTHFVTPHGLPAQGHYTTAYELCLIAREAMRIPFFRQLVSTQRATIPWSGHDYDRVLNNKNKLLSTYAGALGVKTGYTKAAGRCLVFAAERDGLTLIGAVLNCPDWFDQSAALLDRTFAQYHSYTALRAGEIVYRLPVNGGTAEGVDLVTAGALRAPIAEEETVQLTFQWPEALEAGFAAGAEVGTVTLIVDGEAISTVALLTAEGVPERTFLTGIGQLLSDWLLLE